MTRLTPGLITPAKTRKRGAGVNHQGPHGYKRLTTPNGKEQYLCTLPGCTHSLNMPYWIVGKENRCESCGLTYIIEESKNLSCEDCNGKARNKTVSQKNHE